MLGQHAVCSMFCFFCMKTFFSFGMWLGLAGASPLGLAGEALAGTEGEVNVTRVSFEPARSPVDAQVWYEAEIVLAIRPAAAAKTRYVDRVRVTLSLGCVPGSGTERAPVFYRATAEWVAAEEGNATMRFYLPPEVVQRDGLRGDAKYYGVEIEAGGKVQALGRDAISSQTLTSAEALTAFQQRVARDAPANDGVLVPQFLTPFAYDARRPSPSFLRP